MAVNVNIDPSTAPGWMVVLLVAAGLVGELLDNPQPAQGLNPQECVDLCGWSEVESWSPYYCECQQPDPGGEPKS